MENTPANSSNKRVTPSPLKEAETKLPKRSPRPPLILHHVYIENAPEGEVIVAINSEWDTYANQVPDFNTKKGLEIKDQRPKSLRR